MSESAQQAVMRAIINRLATGGEAWGVRVWPDRAPANPVRPYILYFVNSGGERNQVREVDALFSVTIKCVGDTMVQSIAGASRLGELLNDQGTQDVGLNPLDAGPDWEITTVTQGRLVHLVEDFNNVEPVYHDGHVFDFGMGRA